MRNFYADAESPIELSIGHSLANKWGIGSSPPDTQPPLCELDGILNPNIIVISTVARPFG